jgi:hypothetical protein
MFVGAVAVVVIAVAMNRLVGIPHPIWRNPPDPGD